MASQTRRSPATTRGGARRRRLEIETLERRQVLSASNLLPTLTELQASTSDVYPSELTLTNQQRVVRQDVNYWGEVDLYSFTPAWSGTYRFTADKYRSTMDPVIAVYDADGTRIAFNDDVSSRSTNSLATATLTAGATYRFAVTSYDTTSVGRYTIGITGLLQDDAQEQNDTLATARAVSAAAVTTVNGVMADAHDFYRFTIGSTARPGASVALAFLSSQGDLDLRLFDSRGTLLRSSMGDGDGETIDISGLVAGRYFIDVYGYRGAFNPSYQLTLDARPAAVVPPAVVGDAFEPNNSLATASDLGTVTENRSWTGLSVTRGDVDTFRFTLGSAGTASSEVLVDFKHRQGDVDAELLDALGNRIAISQSTSDQERFSLEGFQPGSYAIRVYGYSSAANPDYTLTINQGGGTTVPVDPPPSVSPTGSWTVMIYMTATNLATFGFADVNEMEDALTRVAPGVHFTLFWDQWNQSPFPTGGGTQPAWGTAGRAVLQADANLNTVATTFDITIGERNTGDPATLREFITWSKTNAAAEHYALVMWNHGGGLSGVNFDDESGNDSITVGDLRSAITQAGVPLEVLAYDACLMGMVEQAYETRDLATVLVASEEVIDGPGYNYKTAFQALNSNPSTVTAQALAQGMVSSFTASYLADNFSTFSAVNAAAMDGLAASLKTFTAAAVNLTAANVTTIKTLLAGVTRFTFPEYVDLRQLMQRIATTATLPQVVRTAATGVVTALNQAVFAKMADTRQTGGLAIYLPSTAAQESSSYGLFANFEAATGWSYFVNRMLARAVVTRLGAGVGLSGVALRSAHGHAAAFAALGAGGGAKPARKVL